MGIVNFLYELTDLVHRKRLNQHVVKIQPYNNIKVSFCFLDLF